MGLPQIQRLSATVTPACPHLCASVVQAVLALVSPRTSMPNLGSPHCRLRNPCQIFPGSVLCTQPFPSQIRVFPIMDPHFLRALLCQGPRQFLVMLAGSLCIPIVLLGQPWSLYLRRSVPGPSSVHLVPGLFLPSCFSQNQSNSYLLNQTQLVSGYVY